MKLLVDCRSLSLSSGKGIEIFAISLIESIADKVDTIIVDIAGEDRVFCANYFRNCTNVTFIHDPIPAIFAHPERYPLGISIFCRFIRKICDTFGHKLYVPRKSWASKHTADVVYYPSHRDPLQHKDIPVVTTIHAILPEYGDKELAIINDHAQGCSAAVTSWPHPYKDISARYPVVQEKLFMVPYAVESFNAPSTVMSRNELQVPDTYYFYPAVLLPRKNHMNLIRAYGILKNRGVAVPSVVCTGGNDPLLLQQLLEVARELGVGEKFLFLGHVSNQTMASLYHHCKAALSTSYAEAGMAVINEGSRHCKPVICSDLEAARDHADMLGLDIGKFNPHDVEDMANNIAQFENNIEHYRESAVRTHTVINSFSNEYMGQCYTDIFKFAAGITDKPEWFPYKNPLH
jgi:glycosyltransferase involved in cell wall biosynthesis